MSAGSLRHPLAAWTHDATFHDISLHAQADKLQIAFVTDLTCKATDEDAVIDAIEELFRSPCRRPSEGRMRSLPRSNARCALQPGRNPKLGSENMGSSSHASTCSKACGIERSSTVGIPSTDILIPSGLDYFYLSHRARTIRSTEQPFPEAFPRLLAKGPKFIDGHFVDTRGTLDRELCAAAGQAR